MSTAALERPTLVLNKAWQPVRVATAARCLIMLWNGTAKAVDPHDFQTYSWDDWSKIRPAVGDCAVQTVNASILIPEVVVLLRYSKVPKQTVTFSRRNLFRRDEFQCQYCGCKPLSADLTIDHVLPRAQGGTSTWENCVLACVECNGNKADRTPAQAGMRLRSEPTRPNWRPLYASDGVRIDSWQKFINEAFWNVELES